jgi:hypothetical protein
MAKQTRINIGILESGKKETPRLKTGHIYPIET